jgi:hypothetical protein
MYSAVQDKSANYTVVAGDAGDLLRVTTTSGAVTITLPLISGTGIGDGFKIAVVKWTSDANAVNIARSGSDTINGATSAQIGSQYSQIVFVADLETSQWFASQSGLGATNINVDTFSGNGSTTAFTLTSDPSTKNNTAVYVTGVYQQKSTYSVSGTTLTFTTAPPTGTSNIEVAYSTPLAIGTPSDGTVTTAKLASTTGSGAVVLDTSPTLVTPALGTPSAIVLTNATAVPAAQITGSKAIPKSTLPTGSVLQVVSANPTTTTSSSSSTYADITGLSASITPSSSTSKVLVIVDVTGCKKEVNNTYLALKLLRGSTSILDFEKEGGYNNTSSLQSFGGAGCSYLDSPATTSSTTYKVQLAAVANIASVSVNNSGGYSSITLMEIAA